jgi:ABC-type phosphate transport system substrate-binding protein
MIINMKRHPYPIQKILFIENRRHVDLKKRIVCVLIVSLVLSLAACGSNAEVPNSSTAPQTPSLGTPEIAASPEPAITPSALPAAAAPEYPVIDGSTSTRIMNAAIKAYLNDVYMMPLHSQTYQALERLIPGSDNPADLVLAVKYYDETLADAQSRGAELVITPVAKEGFVFLLNKENPVDRLTQQQLRDIYSGKITNWQEVGGKDEKITLFTRNIDSGSQTAMKDFMGTQTFIEGAALVDAMGFMLHSIMLTPSAIGYNIYTWSLGQDIEQMGLKMVAVDGVAPTYASLADDSYPLLVYTYSYYNKGNEKAEALTDWLLTAEGQKVIASAGYVGIHGDMPFGEPADFDRDIYDALDAAHNYYMDNGWDDVILSQIDMLTEPAQTEALANGKGRHLTIVILHACAYNGSPSEFYRFIVLTRDKGGEFEVINEGEVLSYNVNTFVITPGDTQNHQPPER